MLHKGGKTWTYMDQRTTCPSLFSAIFRAPGRGFQASWTSAEVSVPTWRGRVNLSDLMVFMIFMEHTQALPLRQASALSYPCRCDIKRKQNHQNLRTVRVRVEPWATCCALPKPAYFYRTKKVWALYGITDIPNEACGYLSQTKRLGLQICSMGGRCLTAWSWDKPMWFVWQN